MLPRRFTLTALGLSQVLGIGLALIIRRSFLTTPGDALIDALVTSIPFGLFAGVTGFLGVWAVLGPLSGIIRWPASLGSVALTILAFAMLFDGTDFGWGTIAISGAVIGLQYTAIQCPLWWLRLRHGYQLRLPNDGLSAVGLGETQFSLRHLLVVTTIVGVFLGVGRALIGEGLSRDGLDDFSVSVLLVCLLLGGSNAVITWLALASASRIASWKGWLLVTLVLVPISLLEEQALSMANGISSRSSEIWVVLVLNLVQFAWLSACLLAIRSAGYRLMKISGERP